MVKLVTAGGSARFRRMESLATSSSARVGNDKN
jgi:hypothetical protein